MVHLDGSGRRRGHNAPGGSGAGVGPEIPIEREFMIGRGQQKRQSARLLPTWIQSCQSHGGCEARG